MVSTLCAVLHSLLLPAILPQFFTHSSQFPKRNYSAKIKKKGLSLALFALTDLRTAPPACPGTAPETGYLEQQTQAFRSLACERTCQASALQRPPRLQDATLELVTCPTIRLCAREECCLRFWIGQLQLGVAGTAVSAKKKVCPCGAVIRGKGAAGAQSKGRGDRGVG